MIRSASRFAATSFALFMLASPVLAQQAPQPTASHLALARDVAISSGMTRSIDAMTAPLLAQLQQMNVTRPEVKKDLDDVVEMLKPELELQKQKMVETAAKAFAIRLTEAELKEVSAFYKSPTGVKYVQIQPLLLDDIVTELATWTQNVAEYIMIRARAEMSKRGHQLQ
ncbi:DUF2059 domain-containing protein [Microvirga sp. 2MCAF38]|uniref:DUF2059 domain-containing protein n=1 Tax=Microvirga sp. 2MCAF38 TaxID=3232989 RepID=UPI003F9D2D46